MVKSLAQGEITDVHEVMLAMTRADLSFRMMLEVRNKLLEAYQEVMRMQV
jgi:flagellar hook-basal body complex protein FliE